MLRKSQKIGAFVIAISVAASSIALGEPLAPGKPAGVHKPQMLGEKEWLVAGGIGVLVTAILVANAGDGEHAVVTTQIPTVVNTTSTAT